MTSKTAAAPSKSEINQARLWLQLYKNAKKGDHPSDCDDLQKLAREDRFILQDLALLRARIVCADPSKLSPVAADLVDKKPWLASLNSQRLLQEASVSQDKQLQAAAYLEAAKLSSRNRDKVDWLKKAIEITPQELQSPIFEKLYKVAPRLITNPMKKDWPAVARDLLLHREFAAARKYFDQIWNDKSFSNEERYQAYRQKRNSFKVEQDKGNYLKTANEMLAWLKKTGNSSRLSEAYLSLARGHWTEGNMPQAQKVLDQAEKELKGKIALDELFHLRGRMAEEQGDLKLALQYFNRALNASREHSLIHERLLFDQAWTLRKMTNYEEAAIKFAELGKQYDDSNTRFRYSFWQALSWERAGESEAAKALLQKLANEDILGFYGLLAFYKLGTPMPAITPSQAISIEPDLKRSLSFDTQMMIRSLVLADEKEILEKYFEMRRSSLKNNADGDDSLMFVLQNLAEAGLYQNLFEQLAKLPPESKQLLLQQNPELVFPRKFLSLVEPAAAKFGIEPEFVLSIIRQESSFDPYARSSADAFGLMQVLPSVAKTQEDRAQVHILSHEDLYDPQVNIPIGTALLSQLVRRYDGKLILAAAAYNASEKALAGWIRNRLKNDALEFIEDIPYEETRNYVKLVLRNYIFYQRLSHLGQSMDFPKSCIEDLVGSKMAEQSVPLSL